MSLNSALSWEQRKLGDVVQITMGQSPDGSTYSDEPSDYILVQGNADLQNGWVCPRIWTTQITKKADAGDLIMSVRAPAGAMGKTAYNAVIGRGVAAIKGNEFIYQLLVKMDMDGFWKTLSCGSTFESLNSDNIKNAEVKVPTTAEQVQIGDFFRHLDNLITLHQRKYDKLTNVKKSMLEKMFPKNGSNVPEIRFKGFTEAWEQRKLGDMMNVTSVKRIHQSDWTDSGVRFLRARDIVAAAKNEEPDDYLYISKEKYEEYSALSGKVGVSDLLVTGVGTIGVPYLVRNLEPLYFKDGNIIWFQNSDKIDGKFLFYSFSAEQIQGFINESAGIGTVGTYTIESGKKTPISLPNQIEQAKVGEFFQQLDNLITLHQRKFEKLTNVKKSMLEKMFPQNGSSYPEIRFKGFTDPWEQRKFDEVFDCTVPNNTLSRAELSYDEGTVLNVHYGDVLIKYGSVLDVQKDDIPRIPHRCREDFNGALLQDGDVIIADTAEDETTGKACEIGNLQGSAIVSGLHTMVCRPRNRMALGYLGYYLNSNAYHYQLLPLMQGIKVLSLSRSNIQKTSVSYPIAVKEQQLIAYYFRQLDNLITLHQRQTIVYAVIRSIRKVILAERQYFAPPMVRKSP